MPIRSSFDGCMDFIDWGNAPPHPDSPDICPQWIVVGRVSRGMTIRDLAAAIGRSPAFVSQMESGTRSVATVDVARLSEALDYPPNFFEGQPPYPVVAF